MTKDTNPMELLQNSVIIPAKLRKPHESQIEPPGYVIAIGMGLVYVVNATPTPISSIYIGGVGLIKLPQASNVGQPPQSVPVNRGSGSPPIFSGQTSFMVNFEDGTSYGQTVYISQPGAASLTLWCFYNGFVVSGPFGSMSQLCW